ncbi:unnamed protein product [Pseudo-nitzschia multistriata]|uniref:U6 snRNA phosphodiesterase 1 n=1 Tax=Pseudo-nitzschia multistriata TaxID=183589 RepID=A0A448Z9L4_9STRA|nr:unnamed protein product [Pseudo-nitzschia multistriata]
MDLIALIEDSTDDDSEIKSYSDTGDGNQNIDQTTNGEHNASSKIRRKRTDKVSHEGRAKVIRRGLIDVVSSSKARDSRVFSRSIPHRRGHWAGHVKIPILMASSPSENDDLEPLRKTKTRNVAALQNFLERRGISGTMIEHDNLHLSLSKHFSLQIANIEPFARRLGELLQNEPSTSLHVETMVEPCHESNLVHGEFVGEIIDDIVLLNEEKTRSFFCWRVRPNVTLLRIVAHVDAILKRYNQPVYYQPAHFHISFASFAGNIIESLNKTKGEYVHSRLDVDSERYFQSPSNNVVGASIIGSKNERGVGDDDDDDDDSEQTVYILPVHHVECTLGTTKEYIIPLRTCHPF